MDQQELVLKSISDQDGQLANYRVRFDNVVVSQHGSVKGVKLYDAKASDTARLTRNQKRGYPEISQNGGVFEGSAAKGLGIEGQSISGGTRVAIMNPTNARMSTSW
jgi:hypothetical protein